MSHRYSWYQTQRSISEEVEKMAVARALCAVDRSNVAIMLINAQEGVTEQDKKIAGIIFEKKKACVLAINKWDEEIASESTKEKFLDDLRFHLPFIAYAPVVFLSLNMENAFLTQSIRR